MLRDLKITKTFRSDLGKSSQLKQIFTRQSPRVNAAMAFDCERGAVRLLLVHIVLILPSYILAGPPLQNSSSSRSWVWEINCRSLYDACRAAAAELITAAGVHDACVANSLPRRRPLMFNLSAVRVYVDSCRAVPVWAVTKQVKTNYLTCTGLKTAIVG